MRLFLVVASIVVIGVLVLGVGLVGSALAMENQDSFCASCHTSHTQGAAGLRYLAANRVSQTCDECHAVIGEGETE